MTKQALNRSMVLKAFEKGMFREDRSQTQQPLDESLFPMPRERNGMPTINPDEVPTEAASGGMDTHNFASLLRQGVNAYLFGAYGQTPTTYQQFCDVVQSDKEQEEYIINGGLGVAPIVHEGEPYPNAAPGLFGAVTIKNYKRGFMIPVTEEMRRFDKVGKVRQLSQEAAAAMRRSEEDAVYAVITTTANYNSTSASGENDIGNNYGTTTFSPTGLLTAHRTLVTMKDPKSGAYLMMNPNTLIITPGCWFAAQQLIGSPLSMRAHADADGDVYESYGTGTTNPFYGFVDTIIVSPWLGTGYEWVLMDRSRGGLKFQRSSAPKVEGPYFDETRDVWSYKASTWFGTGFVDDRCAYFSNSTTPPVAD